MLVVNERAAATRSEQCVLDWMRTWIGQYVIVGLAISGYYRPDRNRGGQARQAGLVVFTPRATVVIEAEETTPEVATGVPSVTSQVLEVEELVRKRHPDAFVDGLVVVVPPRNATTTLDIEAPEQGNYVVLGSSAGLRAWFHRTANRKLIWTAEQVHALLGEFRLSHVVTVEDLEAEGFPSQSGRRKRTESRALVGAAHASAPLGAISDTPPVGGSSVVAGQSDSDGLAELRFAEPAPPRPSADDSRALVAAISLSKPSSAPPTAPYPPWLSPDIAGAQSRDAQRSRLAVRADAAPRSHVSALPAEPEPIAAADADQAQSAPPLSSPYTGLWSSWVDSDRPSIPTPPQAEPESPPPLRSGTRSVAESESLPLSRSGTRSVAEPESLRPLRPGTPPAAERSNQTSFLRRVSAARPRISTVRVKVPRLILRLPQLLPILVMLAAVIGTVWLLVSAGTDQHRSDVQPRPASSTVTVAPPQPPAPPRPPEPQCFPFQPGC